MANLKENSLREMKAKNDEQKYEVKLTCDGPHIFAKGMKISMRATLQAISRELDIDDTCAGLKTSLNRGKFKFLNIFALDSVLIDQDMPFPGIPKLVVTIIAPRWEVMGTVKINLNGYDGQSKCCSRPTRHGAHGEPGGPGGPGGAFFGIGGEFVNGSGLTITADGGAGGSGQDGAKGRDGTEGRHASVPADNTVAFGSTQATLCSKTACDDGKKLNGFRCEVISDDYYFFKHYASIKIFGDAVSGGDAASQGGNGGDGGKGGKGGKPGTVLLFDLGRRSRISLSNKNGKEGRAGRGGDGGMGGKNGNDVIVRCTREIDKRGNIYFYVNTWFLEETIEKDRYRSGKKGADGKKDRFVREPPDVAIRPALLLNKYKMYARESLKSLVEVSSVLEFLHLLDNNEDLIKMYNTLSLIDDFQGMEEQYHDLKDKFDFLSIYQSLLSRVSDYALSPNPGESSRQHKKVLNYLYTAILGRIYNLKKNSESDLIVHIAEHLDSLKQDIDSLKDSKKTKNKMEMINKYKKEYKENIDEKIEEAKNLIQKLITPEIVNVGRKIDDNIELLMNETLALQEQAVVEKEVLIEKKRELEKLMPLASLFSTFKILGQALSLFGPIGASIGLTIGTASTMAESLVLDHQNQPQEMLQLPKGAISDIESLQQQFRSVRRQKLTRLTTLLDDVLQESSQYPEHLNDTSTKLLAFREKLNEVDKNMYEFIKVQAIEDKFEQELERKERELHNQKSRGDQNTLRVIRVVKKFRQAVQLGAVVIEAYKKHKNDQLELDLMSEAIKQAENKYKMLKEYENKIYDTITPVLQNIKSDLDGVVNQLDGKSRVYLDLTKWQIQSFLREIKSVMQKLIDGFEVKDDFLSCITHLEETMGTLIDIYDHVQNYQEQQKLAIYIADINSAASDGIHITDSELTRAVTNLGIIMKSNVVLQQYKTAMDAFKQFVFPFAHFYLEELDIPSHLRPGDDIENLISKISSQIEDVKTKLHKYEQSIEKQDRHIGRGEFSCRYISSSPFYVWKNEEHKGMIADLLSGREVLVKADIMNSDVHNKDAVKFNVIELNFKSRNKTLQAEINFLLKGFEVRAVHLGNSYYKYDNKIYLITTNSHVIEYYIEKKPDGNPVDTGGVYDKIKHGDFMLSPFASWKFTLFTLTKRISFKHLLIYKDEIDLELTGEGHYVKNREISVLNLPMEKYYKSIFTLDEDTISLNADKPPSCQHTISAGWLSWLILPSFSILPGADASAIEIETFNHKEYMDFYLAKSVEEAFEQNYLMGDQKDQDNSVIENNAWNSFDKKLEFHKAKEPVAVLDYITIPFINCVKFIKDTVFFKLAGKNSNSLMKQVVNYADYIVEDTPNSLNNFAIGYNDNTNNNDTGSAVVAFDVLGNLTLGQVLVHKMFGANQCLKSEEYVSPARERIMALNQLASEVLPILEENYMYASDE